MSGRGGRHRGWLAGALVALACGATLLTWTTLARGDDATPPTGDDRGAFAARRDEPTAVDATAAARRVAIAADRGLPTLPPDQDTGATADAELAFAVVDRLGRAMPGATVQLFAARRADGRPMAWLGSSEGSPLLSLTTDDEGRSRATCDRAVVYARAIHDAAGRSPLTVCRCGYGRPTTIRLQLGDTARVRGIVLDENGLPAPFVALHIETERAGWEPLADVPLASDGHGRFWFECEAGLRCRVRAGDPAAPTPWFAGRRRTLRWQSAEFAARDGLEITVAREGAITVRGTVIDAAGASADGARIEIWRAERDAAAEERVQTIAEGTGRFESCLPAFGAWRIAARTPDGTQWSPPQDLLVAAHLRHLQVQLRTEPLATITGVAVGADGLPVAGVDVTALPADGRGPLGSRSTRSASDGGFSIAVPAGHRWHLAGPRTTTVEAASGASDLRLVQTAPPPRIHVDAFLPGGERPTKVSILWLRDGLWSLAAGAARLPSTIGPPDENAWSLLLIADGAYGAHGATLPGIDGQRIVLRLDPPGAVQASVRVAGRPVPAAVLHSFAVPTLLPTVTDAAGRATLMLPPGPHSISIHAGSTTLGVHRVVVASDTTTELAIDLPR